MVPSCMLSNDVNWRSYITSESSESWYFKISLADFSLFASSRHAFRFSSSFVALSSHAVLNLVRDCYELIAISIWTAICGVLIRKGFIYHFFVLKTSLMRITHYFGIENFLECLMQVRHLFSWRRIKLRNRLTSYVFRDIINHYRRAQRLPRVLSASVTGFLIPVAQGTQKFLKDDHEDKLPRHCLRLSVKLITRSPWEDAKLTRDVHGVSSTRETAMAKWASLERGRLESLCLSLLCKVQHSRKTRDEQWGAREKASRLPESTSLWVRDFITKWSEHVKR